MQVPSTDGVTVAVHDLGGTGRPLFCSHATGFHAMTWLPIAELLADRYHAWAIDYRGHGASTAPASGDFGWRGMGDDAVAALDAIDLRRPVAIGHSMGGAALAMAEIERPGTFAAMVLFEPILIPPDLRRPEGGPPSLAVGARKRRAVFASRDEAYENYASKPPLNVFTPDALRAYVDHGFVDDGDGSVRLACEPEHEARVFEGSQGADTFARLGEIQCPTLVVSGRVDDFQPSAWAREVALAIPGAHFALLESVGHFGPMQDPELIARTAHAFFHAHA